VTTFSTEQLAGWTQADMDALTGKTITIVYYGCDATTRAVESAREGLGPTLVFEFVGGGGWTIVRGNPEVQITVHDGQGS
jgi:hypothetical protein